MAEHRCPTAVVADIWQQWTQKTMKTVKACILMKWVTVSKVSSSSHADLTSISHSATEEDDIRTVTPVSSSSLVTKKNTRSQVWCHFGLKQVDGRIVKGDKSVCRECFVQVCVKLGKTSNLHSHLKMNHPWFVCCPCEVITIKKSEQT